MSLGDIVSGLRSALSGGAPAWALLFAVMMWIGGGMGAGMGLIDINSLPVHRRTRLERHRIPRLEGRPDHLGHLAWRLDRRRTRAPFWHQDRALVGHHRRCVADHPVVRLAGHNGVTLA